VYHGLSFAVQVRNHEVLNFGSTERVLRELSALTSPNFQVITIGDLVLQLSSSKVMVHDQGRSPGLDSDRKSGMQSVKSRLPGRMLSGGRDRGRKEKKLPKGLEIERAFSKNPLHPITWGKTSGPTEPSGEDPVLYRGTASLDLSGAADHDKLVSFMRI